MAVAYLGLGSNLGDRKQNLAQALELMSSQVAVERLSSIYETEPVGYDEQPLFLNVVCRVSTELTPEKLLGLAKEVEVKLGRVPSFRNAPRAIDIDILFYGDEIVDSQELAIPHPRLVERAFVLVPLAEVVPELVDPRSGRTIGEMLSGLATTDGVRKWAEADEIMNRRQDVSGIR